MPVELDFLMLAEGATAINGKLYVHGGALSQVNVPQLPFPAQLAVAGRLTGGVDELGAEHTFSVYVVQPDGEPVFPVAPIPFVLSDRLPGGRGLASAVGSD